MKPASHPAKFNAAVMRELFRLTNEHLLLGARILDPFAGIGGVHELSVNFDTVGIELEKEWADQHPRNIVGDATHLPFGDESFDAIVTSPAYGNRMADTYDGRDGSKRITYRIALGRMPSEGSAAAMQWGARYRLLHMKAYREVWRVLKPGGLALVNMSDHIRKGKRVPVVGWHASALRITGFVVEDRIEVATPRMRMGENHETRVECEEIIVTRKPSG